jgi:hypothetical protein
MKGKKKMYDKGPKHQDMTPQGGAMGMNMGGRSNFVKMNLKDGTVSGEVKMISTSCANMG